VAGLDLTVIQVANSMFGEVSPLPLAPSPTMSRCRENLSARAAPGRYSAVLGIEPLPEEGLDRQI
jgi:hypothetical protein